MLFSIITPTYNRSHLIKRLYLSLVQQKSFISEWIIIDDGSEDNTRYLIDEFKKENLFPIIYEYHENQGMVHSINLALKYISADYFFKLDSDDFLLKGSLKEIYESISNIRSIYSINEVYAFSLLSQSAKNKPINNYQKLIKKGKKIFDNIYLADYVSARLTKWISGDLLDIFPSKPIINHFRYPIFADEKYAPSAFISYFLSDYYKSNVAFITKTVLVKDYQLDGITKRRFKNKKHTSYGSIKAYLLANIWLLNCSRNKLSNNLLVLKEVTKLSIILIIKSFFHLLFTAINRIKILFRVKL
tara:strand:+ start:975 stop:1880 length:906 start_codon:yes stop_codon:yes gene_type:complete